MSASAVERKALARGSSGSDPAPSPPRFAGSVQFYHLTVTPLERALPKLLEKAYGAGLRALVAAGSDERVEHINQLLWTYQPDSFLPHGSARDGHAAKQPIFLSTRLENVNGAQALFITDGRMAPAEGGYARVLDIFDGAAPGAVESARSRWIAYKESGLIPGYLRQSDTGGWEQKTLV